MPQHEEWAEEEKKGDKNLVTNLTLQKKHQEILK